VRTLLTLGTAVALLLLPGCGAVLMTAMVDSAKAKDAQGVRLSNTDKDAFILILAEPSPIPYVLHISKYDEQKNKLALGTFSGNILVEVEPSTVPVYLAKKVEPGTYVYSALYHQLEWAACFQRDTRQFSVNAGEAVFLGDFKPSANFAQIERLAVASGSTTVYGLRTIFYYDGILPPQITSPSTDSPDFLSAKNYETSSLPSLHGRLQPVVYKPAAFQPGTDLLGHSVCLG
jgi:hypothetical protein